MRDLWRWLLIPPASLLLLISAVTFGVDWIQAYWYPEPGYWRAQGTEANSPEKAIMCFDRALRQDPHDDESYWRRGLNYEMLGKATEATADVRRAIEICPRDPYWETLGNLLLRAGDEQGAIEAYAESLKLGPTNLALKRRYHELVQSIATRKSEFSDKHDHLHR